MKLKKLALGIAAGLTLSSSAFAANAIMFDMDGAGGAYAPQLIDSFDWLPGNALSIGSIGNFTPLPDGTSSQLVYQASLAVLKFGANTFQAPPGKEFTIQASFWELGTGVGGATAVFDLDSTKPSWVRIFYGDKNSNDKTGKDYDDGTMILEGTVVTQTANITNNTLRRPGDFPALGLDQKLDDGDDDGGVMSHQTTGSSELGVNVHFTDSSFFLSDIQSMSIGMEFNSNLRSPFNSVNPSDEVVGTTPVYGANGTMNGMFCLNTADPSAVCDFHFLADGNNTFNSKVPEPASIALLGLGLGALGLGARRRKVK
ncbi:PEP-CTERM sorting domain-containing protein [Chitinivorax sp. B]|uniref:PEP-CTERM sorting domain-containing protein n=1 Tax=Chitinivorax sp. B TaxID=2502235 RepID=UPI002017BDE6|nr:PEP-CTERM sorting domain-containing protein [Chitinivorax sp. B]